MFQTEDMDAQQKLLNSVSELIDKVRCYFDRYWQSWQAHQFGLFEGGTQDASKPQSHWKDMLAVDF